MEINEINENKAYVEKWYPDYYNRAKETISRFNEELRTKLEIYYLKKCRDSYGSYGSYMRSFTSSFCQSLNELNTTELEDYLEYCLEFYEQDFSKFLYEVNVICLKTNRTLKEICSSYMRYSGKHEIEELLEKVFPDVNIEEGNEEVEEILRNIIEIEKKHILNCYEKAKNKEKFCETCAPYCQIKEESGKTKGALKRTTPFRI